MPYIKIHNDVDEHFFFSSYGFLINTTTEKGVPINSKQEKNQKMIFENSLFVLPNTTKKGTTTHKKF